MKKIITCLFLLTILPTSTAEETQQTGFITDDFRADLRSIPSNNGKIINYLRAGTRLIVLEQNDEGWSHIQTSRGTEGWLRSSYLVNRQVAKVRIGEVEQRAAKLKADNDQLQAAIREKDNELDQLQKQLAQITRQNADTREEITSIKKISASSIALHEQNQELLKLKSNLESERDSLTALNDQLKSDQLYTWFLYGALAVCMGALLTVLIPRLKTKRRYSEWS